MESKTRIESGYGEGVADRIDRVGMGWVFKGGSSSEGSLLRKRGVCFRREGSCFERGGRDLLWNGVGIFFGRGEVFSAKKKGPNHERVFAAWQSSGLETAW